MHSCSSYLCATMLMMLLSGCSGGSGDSIEASGTIEGTDINIGTEVSGKVREVRVEEGSRVAKGDTLVIIDDTEYQIQLRQAMANLNSFESAYALAVQGSRTEDILQAEASFKNAEADYQRMKDLLASQTITQKQFDDAYARYVSAQQTYQKLQRGLRPEEISGARERRAYAAAQVDLLRKKVRDCDILAPTSGIVTLRAVEPGELVTMVSNVLRLTYLDEVKLTVYVNETDYGRIRLGQRADVTIDSYPGKSFEGHVNYLSPNAEFTPKNVQTKDERTKLVFAVKIQTKNPEGALKPGLPADAKIFVTEGQNR
jgi:HlyD family secretion protein